LLSSSASTTQEAFRVLPFIGREQELEALTKLVSEMLPTEDRKPSSGGKIIFIKGESGIGKTRLLAELRNLLSGNSIRWLSTRCVRSEVASPYAPWIDLVRQFAHEAPLLLFYQACGNSLSQIAKLIPELASTSSLSESLSTEINPIEKVDNTQPPTPEIIERERVRFYDSIVHFFARLSQDKPVVLAFDDLQWADSDSLRLLQYLTHELALSSSITIFALYREPEFEAGGGNPFLSKVVVELSSEQGFQLVQSIVLNRLTKEDTQLLIEKILPSSEEEERKKRFSDLVHVKTGGNPLFIEEVLRSLIDQGILPTIASKARSRNRKSIKDFTVPKTLRNVIEQRLGSLSQDTVRLLEIASVIGEKFSTKLLQEVAAIDNEADLRRCVDEATRNRVALEERSVVPIFASRQSRPLNPVLFFTSPSSSSLYYFVDEAVREVLYDRVLPGKKRTCHLRTGLALEQTLLSSSETNDQIVGELASELYYHFARGREYRKAIEYSIKAAQRAETLFALEEACTFYQNALKLVSKLRVSESRKILQEESKKAKIEFLHRDLEVQLLERLGNVLFLIGRMDEALNFFAKAAAICEEIGQKKKAGFLYSRTGYILHFIKIDREAGVKAFDKSLELLIQEGDSRELAQLYLYLGHIRLWESKTDAAIEMFDRSIEIANKFSAYNISSHAMGLRAIGLPIRQKDRAIADIQRALRVVNKTKDMETITVISFIRAETLAQIHPSKRSIVIFDKAIEQASKRGIFHTIFMHQGEIVCQILLPLGDWKKAKEKAYEIYRMGQQAPPRSLPRLVALSVLGQVLLHLGDLDEAETNVKKVEEATHGFGVLQIGLPVYITLGKINMEKGLFDLAEKYLTRGYELSKKAGVIVSNAFYHVELVSTMMELALRQGRKKRDLARLYIGDLWAISKEIDEQWAGAYYLKAQGMYLSSTQTDWNKALQCLEESLNLWQKLGFLYQEGKTWYELGITHFAKGDREADLYFKKSVEIFKRLGAKIELERALVAKKANDQLLNKEEEKIGEDSQRFLFPISSGPDFLDEKTNSVFESLAEAFIQDYRSLEFSIEKSGWRTLKEVAERARIPPSLLYGRRHANGRVLRELLRSGSVETKVFPGERGRGGQILRIRLAFGTRRNVRMYLNRVMRDREAEVASRI
jgi:predicted ATPase